MFIKFLNVNSAHRSYGVSHDCRYELSPSMNIHGARIASLSLPMVDYNAKSLTIVTDFGNVVIADGVYTIDNITTAIEDAFTASAYTGTATVSYDSIQYKLTITGTIAFEIISVSNSMLGFSASPSSLTHEAVSVFSLSQPPAIGISISELQEDCRNVNTSVGNHQTFIVYHQGNSGDFLLFAAHTNNYNDTPSSAQRNISSLTVRLTNMTTGLPYDLRGADYSMLLETF